METAAASADKVLLLGDPRLRKVAAPVRDFADPVFQDDGRRLVAKLHAFRAAYGFGRAMAAPQLGIDRRLIALDLGGGEGPHLLVNPVVTWTSNGTFTLWDDCMSFPSLLVRVRRADSLSLRFCDDTGAPVVWERVDRARSELLQHELDHLDGILAVDRALDRDAIVLREVYDADPARFRAQVDYEIGEPPISPARSR